MTQTITPKQQELIFLLPRFRFLSSTHIQQFLHHTDKKRINTWLKDLTKKEYIRRIYDDRIIGKNRVPAIYLLNTRGIQFLKAQDIHYYSIRKLSRDNDRSETFIEHSLLLATICCQLEQKNSDILHYEYVTETDYSDSDSEPHFLKEAELAVDLCFSKKQKGKKVQHFLLALFDATLPKYRIRKRIRDYYDFYFSNQWENNMDTSFPTILFVFQTKERMIYAKRYTKTMLEEDKPDDLSINFAVTTDVQIDSITGAIWEEV